MKRLLLTSYQSPGDIVLLTAAVRDLHAAHPGHFVTDVRTSAPDLWAHNPHLTPLGDRDAGVEVLDMHYPLIHESNQRPYHFIHGYAQYLETRLGLRIPVTRFYGDIHLSAEEKAARPHDHEYGLPEHFWILIAGGKFDFTAKWWNPAAYQAVVDHFRGRLTFAQCGEAGHWHPRLQGVVDLVGKTTTREFIRLMHHADGVVCPITFAMHLAAAVETKHGTRGSRPCVVIAGGREPAHWEAYPNHQFISTNGALSCCKHGGCWKSRCQLVGDGNPKDSRDVCEQPVQVAPDLRIPRCMDLISPDDVIRRIEWYYLGGAMTNGNGHTTTPAAVRVCEPIPETPNIPARPAIRRVLLEFQHGLGDAIQLTAVLRHLRQLRPNWEIDVSSLVGKHSAFHNLCARSLVQDRDPIDVSRYDECFCLDWHEARDGSDQWPSTKATRCLREVFNITPIADLCRYEVAIGEQARKAAQRYLASVCSAEPDATGRRPVILIHYEGNTSADRKNLPQEVIREVCDVALRHGCTPVILDWDQRSHLVDQQRIFCPGADHELWGNHGTGDAEVLAALIEGARLMIGVDSGPLHVAGATGTATIGVWTRHHPVHFFDLADNVIHFVPGDHEQLVQHTQVLPFFHQHYRHHVYKQLFVELPAYVESLLTNQPFETLANQRFLEQLRSRSFHKEYYVEHKAAGLDYLGFGDWQQRYGRWLAQSFGWVGQRVLDVGCACGSILRGLGEAGVVVQGVDVNEYMIQLGRQQWPDMAPLLYVCDAVNLHLLRGRRVGRHPFRQVAEHWKPELVPFILRELHRVVRPGGIMFCALDTTELFARQGRTMDREDPTHVCVRPIAWWHEQLAASGWRVASNEYHAALRDHDDSFLRNTTGIGSLLGGRNNRDRHHDRNRRLSRAGRASRYLNGRTCGNPLRGSHRIALAASRSHRSPSGLAETLALGLCR